MTLFSALHKLPEMEVLGFTSTAIFTILFERLEDELGGGRKTPNGVILAPFPSQTGRWLVVFCAPQNKHGT